MNEDQYFQPIVNAMMATQKQQAEAEQLKVENAQRAQQMKLQEHHLALEEKKADHQHEYESERLRLLVDEGKARHLKEIREHILSGGNPSTLGENAPMQGAAGVGPLGQGSIIPSLTQDPNKPPPTVSVGGNETPISQMPSQGDMINALQLENQAKIQKIQVPAGLRDLVGSDYAPHDTVNTALRMHENAMNAAENRKSREKMAEDANEMKKYLGDQNNLTRAMIAANRPNAINDKIQVNKAIRDAFQDSGGDWNKVKENAANLKYGPFSSDILEHVDKITKLPASSQTKVAAAESTIDSVSNAIQAIKDFTQKHPDMIGSGWSHPSVGVKRWFQTKTGTEPDDIGAVDTALTTIAAFQPQQHGFRSSKAMEEFKQNLGIDFRTNKYDPGRAWLVNPGKAISALQSIAANNNTIKNNLLKTAGGSSTPTPTVEKWDFDEKGRLVKK